MKTSLDTIKQAVKNINNRKFEEDLRNFLRDAGDLINNVELLLDLISQLQEENKELKEKIK